MLVIKYPLTFSHIPVAGNCAFFACGLTGSSGRQADQADSLLQVSLPVQLQQGDVVVQGLTVVVVVDVCCRHPEGLCTWRAKLLCEIMISYADIYGIPSSDNAEEKNVSHVSFLFGILTL